MLKIDMYNDEGGWGKILSINVLVDTRCDIHPTIKINGLGIKVLEDTRCDIHPLIKINGLEIKVEHRV